MFFAVSGPYLKFSSAYMPFPLKIRGKQRMGGNQERGKREKGENKEREKTRKGGKREKGGRNRQDNERKERRRKMGKCSVTSQMKS